MLRAAITVAGHVCWLLSCLPGWLRYRSALGKPREAQERVLSGLLAANRNTGFGRAHGFGEIRSAADYALHVPLAEYEHFKDAIRAVQRGEPSWLSHEQPELLEPTSGTAASPKLIPVTRSLRREFSAAVEPWIVWMYFAHPRILLGRHYWAISPNTSTAEYGATHSNAVPVGFSDDGDYLGPLGRLVSRQILVNPRLLRSVNDPEEFRLVTLLFLLADKNLRLISVWHPSFLTLLLEAIPRCLPVIVVALRTGRFPDLPRTPGQVRLGLARHWKPNRHRAEELQVLSLPGHHGHLSQIWPRLALISCWGGAKAEPWLTQLRACFPQVSFQYKGLLATEGCVTLPTGDGRRFPCALTSHYLEFLSQETGEVRPLWELEQGGVYSVVLTTGGGLWRYRLHDLVQVVGLLGETPCLEFLGKDNAVSDLVGEKLGETQVALVLQNALSRQRVAPAFAMVVPDKTAEGPRYVLLLEGETASASGEYLGQELAALLETGFCTNFHYAHARRLGQLQPVTVVRLRNALALYTKARAESGCRLAVIKVPALETSRRLFDAWWKI